MAEHVWSVLCDKLLVDEETHVSSLIAIPEKITIHRKLEELDGALRDSTGFMFPLRLVTLCVRSDIDKPETFDLRTEWALPRKGRLPLGETHVSLENASTVRLRTVLKGIPWDGPGRYWIVVEKKDEGKKWAKVARLPLEIVVEESLNPGA